MKVAIALFLLASSLVAAPLSIKNDKALKAKIDNDVADAMVASIQTNANYATYTNIVSILSSASSWGQAQPALIAWFEIDSGLKAAEEVRKGKGKKK